MAPKEISMKTYQLSHFGVIIFEVLVYGLIAYLSFRVKESLKYMKEASIIAGKNKIKRKSNISLVNTRLFATIIFWTSIFMIIFNLFGLWPVFKDYPEGINIR
jgi:predicted membrane protein